jgi:hypothetical protein
LYWYQVLLSLITEKRKNAPNPAVQNQVSLVAQPKLPAPTNWYLTNKKAASIYEVAFLFLISFKIFAPAL